MNDTKPEFEITKQWVTAGNAIFTVANGKGDHCTYRVSKVKKDEAKPPVWFVNLLTGPDNESDYTYLGMLDPLTGEVRLTRASKMSDGSQAVRVLRWAMKIVFGGQALPEGYSISGEGRCGRCGRTLTHPDGVADAGYRFGFGPVCWDKIQNGE